MKYGMKVSEVTREWPILKCSPSAYTSITVRVFERVSPFLICTYSTNCVLCSELEPYSNELSIVDLPHPVVPKHRMRLRPLYGSSSL